MSASTPLEGLLVADFSRVLAGPLATMTLADLGARVVKVERPGSGDDTRSWGPPYSASSTTYFESVNRGKESVALDLSDPQDQSLALELACRADVVISNFVPGTMERLGLGYDTVRARNPRVVYCVINGFGSEAGSALLGYDFVVQAVGGLMSITGGPDEPTKVGVAVVDVLTGKDAVIAILAALAARERTGVGDHLEVSLLTSCLAALANQGQAALETGSAPRALGNQHPSIAPYETLRCRDGLLAVACGNNAQFARLTEVLGAPELADRPDLADNAARVTHREVLVAELEARLVTEDVDHWVARLTERQVPAGRVGTILDGVGLAQDLGLDPLVRPGSGTPQIRYPVRWATHRTADPLPPPALGQHDASVRAWLRASPEAGQASAQPATPPQPALHPATLSHTEEP